MKISNKHTEAILNEMREPGRCEVCGKYCAKREPCHLFASQMGGTPMNVRINLLACGSSRLMQCLCHSLSHDRSYGEYDPVFLDAIAKRDGHKKEDIVAVLRLFKQLVKPTVREILMGIMRLETTEQIKLAIGQLREADYL